MAGQITRRQLMELESAWEYLSDETFEEKLKEYTGITRTPYTGYSYYDASGNYLCDSDEFDLRVAMEDAYIEVVDDGQSFKTCAVCGAPHVDRCCPVCGSEDVEDDDEAGESA